MSDRKIEANYLADGRRRVTIYPKDADRSWAAIVSYTSVRNIDGSNRLMADDGGWHFLPDNMYGEVQAAFDALRIAWVNGDPGIIAVCCCDGVQRLLVDGRVVPGEASPVQAVINYCHMGKRDRREIRRFWERVSRGE